MFSTDLSIYFEEYSLKFVLRFMYVHYICLTSYLLELSRYNLTSMSTFEFESLSLNLTTYHNYKSHVFHDLEPEDSDSTL